MVKNSGWAGSRPCSLDQFINFPGLGISADGFKHSSWNQLGKSEQSKKLCFIHDQVPEFTLLKPLFIDNSIDITPNILKQLQFSTSFFTFSSERENIHSHPKLTRFSWIAGLSFPRARQEAWVRNSGKPRIGRYSWFRLLSLAIFCSTFLTTGKTQGWESSVR